eukprot:TRINITY_DN1481_c4_g1_i1.p1 TRINITY_DN1481_c4_g1~~TRINITY_DN1481_c4_g1_i1.p1  ORF type:complete len:456 (-),score=108.17 TRINITY_DN1481_c4_g1_i1:79-1392(-)
MAEIEPGDLDDDLPPLVGEDGEELPADADHQATASEVASDREHRTVDASSSSRPTESKSSDSKEEPDATPDEEEVLRAAAGLRAQAALKAQSEKHGESSALDAISAAMAEAEEPRKPFKEPDEKTKRMIAAISKDDFEECEDAIMQGADVNADCGAGMCALHISALRGEMFLTELLIAHGADVNQRDLSGNTPLLYACHFYRQHQMGVQLVAQLLYHKGDPHYRVKDGKLAGKSAHDLMEKACNEPNVDESVPRQMRAMLQLAIDGTETAREAITKMWMQTKSQNKKLYQVSSTRDNFDYVMKSVDWVLPENAKNAQAYTPVKLEAYTPVQEEKFTQLHDYLFTDEGDKVKVYVTFPEAAAAALAQKEALEVSFDYQSFDLKLRGSSEKYRLRIDPLFGSIEVDQCKHRISSNSQKVALTLAKRHKNRIWSAIQKPR